MIKRFLLEFRIFIADLEYHHYHEKVGETGGESSPYFWQMQEAEARRSYLRWQRPGGDLR